MPLVIDRGETPTCWEAEGYGRSTGFPADRRASAESLNIALVNNMPDAAVEDTESQFFGLISGAANGLSVHARLYSLPNIPRSERTEQYLRSTYSTFGDLLNRRFDGVIITGTEPRQPDLRQEPYWQAMTEMLGWAEENTSSTVLSCLAAHAGVLYSDGIERNPLGDKQFGVFEHQQTCQHLLTDGAGDPVRIPHSRWNEVRERDLLSNGYTVLTKSPDAGVDLFVREKKQSLFVHFQGHPEYGGQTLLKEYRRDVKRYLKRERDNYPSPPEGYFAEAATKLLTDFESYARAHRREGIMETFPEADLVDTLQNTWRGAATQVYRNWLEFLTKQKMCDRRRVVLTVSGQLSENRRSLAS